MALTGYMIKCDALSSGSKVMRRSGVVVRPSAARCDLLPIDDCRMPCYLAQLADEQ